MAKYYQRLLCVEDAALCNRLPRLLHLRLRLRSRPVPSHDPTPNHPSKYEIMSTAAHRHFPNRQHTGLSGLLSQAHLALHHTQHRPPHLHHGPLLDTRAPHHLQLQRICLPRPFTLQRALTSQMEDFAFPLLLLGQQLHMRSLLWRMPGMYSEGYLSQMDILVNTTVVVDRHDVSPPTPRESCHHDKARASNSLAIP